MEYFKDVVCIAPVDWEPLKTRIQNIMIRLPKDCKILYVEPPVTYISYLKDKNVKDKMDKYKKGIRKVEENIFVITPPPFIPFYNMYPLINRINQKRLALFLKPIINKLGLENYVLWTYLPNSIELLGKLHEKFVIYDCVDEHSEFTGLINKDVVLEMEKGLIEKSDLVFYSAKNLYERKKIHNKNSYLIPNAADIDLFLKSTFPETPIAQDIANIKKPIIGFIGAIHDWIDLDVIKYIAEKRPEWSIVMIGPVGPNIDIKDLEKLNNLHFLGKRSPSDLPKYLKAFDVCINPFKLNNLTENVNPLKIYEYLASGKPIVSSKMKEILHFSDIIYFAESGEDFIKKIEKALSENKEKVNKRIEVAKENSWDRRMEVISNIIENYHNNEIETS